jgi:uncharacterized membrane protein
VTLRRILAFAPTLSEDERTRVAEHLMSSKPSADEVLQALKAK